MKQKFILSISKAFILLAIYFTFPAITLGQNESNPEFITFDNPAFLYTGRFAFSDSSAKCSWPGSSVKFNFEGSSLKIKAGTNSFNRSGEAEKVCFVNIIVDGKVKSVIKINSEDEIFSVDSLDYGLHEVEIYKRTEAFVGEMYFYGIYLTRGSSLMRQGKKKDSKIEFIGNSITCGYGNEGDNQNCPFSAATENQYMSYAAIAARELKADAHYIAYSGKGVYWNYNKGGGETMPELYERINPEAPGHLENIYNSSWSPTLYVINLGTNDFSHEVPDSLTWVNAYFIFIEKLKKKSPDAKFILVVSPMINDSWPEGNRARSVLKSYLAGICTLYKQRHTKSDIKIMEMSQQGDMGFGCDWHPNISQHKKNAEELVHFIRKNKML